eukprot:TRINITY_DN10130_c0_g1_i6.p1 TRINITY_DN10130_c0_g1~~TRINITY_DN10130_c0_g1_i6.p1  ORF type:complete len:454 (-),score=3.68 TRINITY_DN10130_c0_g1_i6:26-1387(-)
MILLLLLNLFSTTLGSLRTTAYFTDAQTYDCSSGVPCFSAVTTCGNSNCYFDVKVTVPSGQTVDVNVDTTSGVTTEYVKWGGYAVQGNANVNGPFYNSFYAWTCATSSTAEMYVRIYCYSSQCTYSITLTPSMAINECGMTWQEQASTECDSNCRQNSHAKCYYATHNQYAPSNSICDAGLGTYVPAVSACPIDSSCGINSVCQGPWPPTCTNLCDSMNCGIHGICEVANAQAKCTCSGCYSGEFCEITPIGEWINKSWSDCDCDDGIQTRTVSCETSFGCPLPESYCDWTETRITQRNCTASCPLSLDTIISEVTGDWFWVSVIGGASILFCCCMSCILLCVKRQNKRDEKEKNGHLHIQIPTALPPDLSTPPISGYNISPSHSANYRSPSPLPLSSSQSLSRPAAPSMSYLRPLTPTLPRPMTPSHALVPRQIGRAVQQECRDRSRMPSSA